MLVDDIKEKRKKEPFNELISLTFTPPIDKNIKLQNTFLIGLFHSISPLIILFFLQIINKS